LDFRAKYWVEAERQIHEASRYEDWQAGYFGNILCAIANAAMASLPDSVVEDVQTLLDAQKTPQRKTQGRIKRDLNA
jgi:hypothetical protein